MKLRDLQELAQVLDAFKNTDASYNTEYVSNTPYEIPGISRTETRFLHMTSVMEKALHKSKIRFEYIAEDGLFRIRKYLKGSKFPTFMYLAVYWEERTYAFGGEETDVIEDADIRKVVAKASEWLNNDAPAVR